MQSLRGNKLAESAMTVVSKELACRALFLIFILAAQTSCSGSEVTSAPVTETAATPASITEAAATPERVSASVPETVLIPAGDFVMGSDAAEREYGYRLDEIAYGHSRTRTGRWYDSETDRTTKSLDSFEITVTPVTNAQYLQFIEATSHRAPDVDRQTWDGYGLIHPFERAQKYIWNNNQPPAGRENHPVVMVAYEDAQAYAQWLSEISGDNWRLPSEPEWEKSVRGTDGRIFPWGDTFDSNNLNSHDAGPFDTVAVGASSVAGPFGLLDGAGQVFEWTLTPGANRAWVKGGSWDDSGCGVCRPAARHSRPKPIKHILIGFRLVKTP